MTSKQEERKPIQEDDELEKGSEDEEDGGMHRILVEIVSALNVPRMDVKSESDPFVEVSMGGQVLHKTKHINDSVNPIWTLETGSLFLLEFAKDSVDLEQSAVFFVVKDYDGPGKKEDVLGAVAAPVKALLNGKGERETFPLDVPPDVLEYNKKKKRFVSKRSKLVLRCKPASIEEYHFIKTLDAKQHGIFANETFLPPRLSNVKSSEGTPQIAGWGAQILATQMGSDKTDSLLEQAFQPSQDWIEVGSGTHGRVYLEVLGCNDLPNLDSPTIGNLNNMTDAYCCLIMEDSIVNTTVIKDTLSPRWLPNDRRAFVFHVHHPSSQLYIGVFDHDKVTRVANAMKDRVHDPIGRVLVNLTHFRPGTLYTLHYHLYLVNNSAEKSRAEQAHNGTLTIRLRIEWGSGGDSIQQPCIKGNDTKNMLIEGMLPPHVEHLAVPNRHDFRVAHYTIVGKYDPQKFNLKTLTGYVEEIQTYVDEEVITMVAAAALTILLWRGHYEIRVFGKSVLVPFHSMAAFAWGVLVTQNYNRFLSFLLFCVAWFFLATNEYRRSHPSPWHRGKSFAELLGALLVGTICGCLGKCVPNVGNTTIEHNENLPAVQAYYDAVKARREQQAKQKEQAIEHAAQMEQEEMKQQMQIDSSAIEGVVNIATGPKDSFMGSMNPLKPILHPVQMILYQVCRYLRITKSIVTWEENYYPFWITLCSMLGALLFFFIPWGFILRWVVRIAVWVVLGPWMKLVDWMYFGKLENMTAEEKKQMLEDDLRNQYQETLARRMRSEEYKEDMVKLKSMLKYLFGKYLLEVPRFRESRFLDYPLPASTAEPVVDALSEADLNVVGQICGQTLTGPMIPTRMIQEHPLLTEEPEDTTSFLRVWGHSVHKSISSSQLKMEEDEPTKGEEKPLLPKTGKKKKKKWYGLFPRLRK
ncbi:expressed unknown protein [Seminavis robusta]|uniref:C2 domain-containing protein n=1 Tax=Seminavis robusta TaxID=568900 RepID=A0A9N8HDH9_9STRA|nr:expressed unknown protein [Seminavis robusta]|eukprot:Sro344_g122330.1 n/a (919) ;mRNA; r:66878-69971